MELGFFRNVKVILHCLLHVLHLSALSFLLLYLLKALSSSPSLLSSYSILLMLFFLYLVHSSNYLASPPNPTLDPATLAPTVGRDVLFKLAFAVYSISSAFNLNNDYTPGAITKICANFAIVFVLGVMAGTLYAALTLFRLANYGEVDAEKQKQWPNLMIKWSVVVVKASIWIAGGAAALSIADFSLQFTALNGVRSVIWRWAAAGLSVGLLPLLFLCAISTQAALYIACKKHHEQCKEDPLIGKV